MVIKRVILFLLFSLSIVNADNFNKDFKVAITIQSYQDCEGGGFYLGYKLYNDLLIETSYNTPHLRGIKEIGRAHV